MESTNLVTICISAFLAVFVLLLILAAVMRLVLVVFPHRNGGADAAVVAAISLTMNTIYPGSQITKIEEIR